MRAKRFILQWIWVLPLLIWFGLTVQVRLSASQPIEVPEEILFQFTTTGEWKESFKPQLFLKITGTDLSRCLVNGRLKVDLNGEIYWIRLEKDSTELLTLEEYDNEFWMEFEAMSDPIPTGIECPECGSELVYSDNMLLTSFPPQRNVHCPNCQHSTRITVW